MRIMLISVFCLIMVGCAGLQLTRDQMREVRAVTSGKIGCPFPDIENARVKMSTSSWTAKCEGKTYFCSGDDFFRGVTCTETK
ncbi:MAG: hypothetical protein FJ241_11580 [Nitrospira sp.]|nr:hypothetical protein [Nitrospira sp.]